MTDEELKKQKEYLRSNLTRETIEKLEDFLKEMPEYQFSRFYNGEWNIIMKIKNYHILDTNTMQVLDKVSKSIEIVVCSEKEIKVEKKC